MKKYTIKKGKHDSRVIPSRFYAGSIGGFAIKFKVGWHPKFKDDDPDGLKEQISKIGGVSSCYHKRSSVRVGWRHVTGDLYDVFIYARSGGVIHSTKVFTAKYGRTYAVIVHFTYGAMFVDWRSLHDGPCRETLKFSLPRMKSKEKYWLGYVLEPYYGGKYPAPSNIAVDCAVELFKKSWSEVSTPFLFL